MIEHRTAQGNEKNWPKERKERIALLKKCRDAGLTWDEAKAEVKRLDVTASKQS